MADRSNFQAAIKSAVNRWSKTLLNTAKSNAPKHIQPHIYTKVGQTSAEKYTIGLGVKMVEAFSKEPRTKWSLPGAVVNGGSMDAAALEYGSESHIIAPRKRQFKSGKVLKKYGAEYKKNKTWLGVGMATQRSWMLIPNDGRVPVGAGEGFKANTTKDGEFVFVDHPVEHPGSKPYQGRGYLRISITQTKREMMETEKKSIAKAIGMDVIDNFRKSAKVLFK